MEKSEIIEGRLRMLDRLAKSETGRTSIYKPVNDRATGWSVYMAAEQLVDLGYAAWDPHKGFEVLRITAQGVDYYLEAVDAAEIPQKPTPTTSRTLSPPRSYSPFQKTDEPPQVAKPAPTMVEIDLDSDFDFADYPGEQE